MKYRVINKITKEDVTDKHDWVIRPDGKLFYLDYEDLIGDPDVMYIPEKCLDEFYNGVETLKSLNYYNNNSNIKVCR